MTDAAASLDASPSAATSPVAAAARRLFAPVDVASLVYFRILFGALMLVEVLRYLGKGWVKAYFVDPTFHFKYYGFGWVEPLPGGAMYALFVVLGAAALCILLGLFYRVATVVFFVGFTWVFLIEQTLYLNHFYLLSLVSFLMIFIPAHRAFSLDARRRPALRSDVVPSWALWLLLAQLSIVYFYAGVAKCNGDWIRGWPLRIWLADQADFPVIGGLLAQGWVAVLMSWGGLLLDLLIAPALLWSRTRRFAFVVAAGFHLLNSQLFSIGIFPWFMLGASALYFPPSWPRRIFSSVPIRRAEKGVDPGRPLTPRQRLVVGLVAAWLAVQLLIPLRPFLHAGNASWTNLGHRFSWRMKLDEKVATEVGLYLFDPATGKRRPIDLGGFEGSYSAQIAGIRPDMILQLAHLLAGNLREKGIEAPDIRARVLVSMNGRQPQPMIDPNVNLAEVERGLGGGDWIQPLTRPRPAADDWFVPPKIVVGP